MNTIGRILHVLLYITLDTSPAHHTHTPIATTLPTPVLSHGGLVDKVATAMGHTHTHTHTHTHMHTHTRAREYPVCYSWAVYI